MKRLLLVAAVILHVCVFASHAEAQTCSFSGGALQIATEGVGGDHVMTTGWWSNSYSYTGCTTRTETWVEGLTVDQKICFEGSLVTGACYWQASETGASTRQSSQGVQPWGFWTGRSNYTSMIIATGTSVSHGSKSSNKDFGPRPPTPQEECEGYNGSPPLGVWYNDMCNYYTPIIIPTVRGEVWKLTTPEDGVLFDLNGDGVLEQVSWTRPGSYLAFLAIDRDGDGQITSGLELLGNHTLTGVETGFEALAALMPHNGDGSIDIDDPIYPRLLLWTDRNHNGMSEPTELKLASSLVTKIGLGYFQSNRIDENGNVFAVQGWAELRTAHGRNQSRSAVEHSSRLISIYDVIFRVLQ